MVRSVTLHITLNGHAATLKHHCRREQSEATTHRHDSPHIDRASELLRLIRKREILPCRLIVVSFAIRFKSQLLGGFSHWSIVRVSQEHPQAARNSPALAYQIHLKGPHQRSVPSLYLVDAYTGI